MVNKIEFRLLCNLMRWVGVMGVCCSIASCSPLPSSPVNSSVSSPVNSSVSSPVNSPVSLPRSQANANALPTVVSTGDGDTLRVDRQGEILTVRIACIDAPESDQPGGEEAAARLRQLLPKGQAVQVRDVDVDRYGRTVAELFLGNEPVGLRLVREGYAVVYDQYLQGCSETQELYTQAETAARAAHLGFWSQDNPVMPWDWRRQHNSSTPASSSSSNSSNPSPSNLPPSNPPPHSSPNSTTATTAPACATTDCDCRDFRTQAEAQRFFDSLSGDPHRLDRDGDRRVCEALP
ncbi:MAG TPA: thermonuclease family protein [Allocoleopsis sp.]